MKKRISFKDFLQDKTLMNWLRDIKEIENKENTKLSDEDILREFIHKKGSDWVLRKSSFFTKGSMLR